MRLPSPTPQEYIHEAHISEEYRTFLRATDQKHLLINLQDRNSWKEGARAEALEHLQKERDFANQLTVVTLGVHGDFYLQKGAYRTMDML